MEKQWYLFKDNQQMGPYSWEQLNDQTAKGMIVTTDFLWSEGMSDWISADQIEGLNLQAAELQMPTEPEVAPSLPTEEAADMPPPLPDQETYPEPPPLPFKEEANLSKASPPMEDERSKDSFSAEEPVNSSPLPPAEESPGAEPPPLPDSDDIVSPTPSTEEETPSPPPVPEQQDEQLPPQPPADPTGPPPVSTSTKRKNPVVPIIAVLVVLLVVVGVAAVFMIMNQQQDEVALDPPAEEEISEPFDDPFSFNFEEADTEAAQGEDPLEETSVEPERTVGGSVTEPIIDDETEYIDAVSNNSSMLGKAFNEISRLTGEPELTEDWINAMEVQIVNVRFHVNEARQLNPPYRFKKVHAVYLNAMDKYEESVDNLVEGIDETDPDKVNISGNLMVEGSAYVKQAVGMLDEIQ